MVMMVRDAECLLDTKLTAHFTEQIFSVINQSWKKCKISRSTDIKDWERFCGFHGQQKKTNEWVLNRAGVKREPLDTVKARKLAYYGHTMRKQGSCLE